LIIIHACLSTAVSGLAQVGVGTASVDASARFQVDAHSSTNAKGFLPPRVELQGTNDAQFGTAGNPSGTPRITSPATGLLVYNTATAGSGTATVTPGLYYYDGSKWQRIINQPPDATVEFTSSNDNPNTGGTSFSGTAASRDVVYVSSGNASQWTYNGSAYVTYTPPASTAWYAQSSPNDAGSNKTSGVYRTGNVGIGTTSFTPSTKLDIRASTAGTGFRLVDGSQGANKVLQSDANGNASWVTNVAVTPSVIGVMYGDFKNTKQNECTGAYIELPPGKWSVTVSMLAQTSSSGTYWIRSGFSTNSANGSTVGEDAIGANMISGLNFGGKFSMLNGTIIIWNQSASTKTYYYHLATTGVYDGGNPNALFIDIGTNKLGENSIIAYPMN